jgi:hypothetical protein
MMNEMQLLSQFEDYIINDLRLKRMNCCIKYDKQNEKLILGIFDKKVYQETIQNIQQNLNSLSLSSDDLEKLDNVNNIINNQNCLNYQNNVKTSTKKEFYNQNEQEIDDLVDSLNNLNQICNKVSCSEIENKKYYTLSTINLNDQKQNKALTQAKEQQLNLFIKYQNLSRESSETQQYKPDFSVDNSKNFFNLNLENLSLKNKFDANHQFFNFADSLVVIKYVDFELYQQLMKSEESSKIAHIYNHTSVKNTLIESVGQSKADLHLFDEIQNHRNKEQNRQHKSPVCMNANIYHSVYKHHDTDKATSECINDDTHTNKNHSEKNLHVNTKSTTKKTMAF